MLFHSSTPNARTTVKTAYDQTAFFKKIAPQAQKLSQSYGVKASVIMAQAALESDYGTDLLAAKYYNLLATKASAGQQSIKMSRTEYVGSNELSIKSDFRVYADWTASLNDYMARLKAGEFGKSGLYTALATADNYQTAIQAFQEYEYTSDSNYSKNLKTIIETYNLVDYDS
nr:glucosaminidase domain-containing protein [Streptococcus loxodontisalivarius]